MRPSLPGRSMALASVVLVATMGLVAACSSPAGTNPATGPATATVSATSETVALGTNNPPQGDCTTNTSEAATSVGSVVLDLTTDSSQAQVQLQQGSPNMTYGVFLQQVPGSCPQPAANAGTLTTDATGHGQASTSVPRQPGATTFFVQLVPAGADAPTFTSDRITAAPGE